MIDIDKFIQLLGVGYAYVCALDSLLTISRKANKVRFR